MKQFFRILNRDLFIVSVVTLFIYFIVEIKIPGMISNYVHFGYLITLVFVSGILYAWQPPQRRTVTKRSIKRERNLTIFVAILSAWCMFLLARPLGWGAYVLASILCLIMLAIPTQKQDPDKTI